MRSRALAPRHRRMPPAVSLNHSVSIDFGVGSISAASIAELRQSVRSNSTASFYRWRSLIGEVHDADSTGERVPAPGRFWSPGTAFLDLGPVAASGPATDDAPIRPEGGLTVRLDLGDGLVLTLVAAEGAVRCSFPRPDLRLPLTATRDMRRSSTRLVRAHPRTRWGWTRLSGDLFVFIAPAAATQMRSCI